MAPDFTWVHKLTKHPHRSSSILTTVRAREARDETTVSTDQIVQQTYNCEGNQLNPFTVRVLHVLGG